MKRVHPLRACRSKVTLLVIGTTAAACLALTVAAVHYHRGILEHGARLALSGLAQRTAVDVGQRLDHLAAEVHDLALNPEIQERWAELAPEATEPGHSADAEDALRDSLWRFAERHGAVTEARIDEVPTGRVLFSTLPDGMRGRRQAKDELRRLEPGEVYISPVFASTISLPDRGGEPELAAPAAWITTPLRGGGEVETVLTLRIDPRRLLDTTLRGDTVGREIGFESLQLYLVDLDGRLVSRLATGEGFHRPRDADAPHDDAGEVPSPHGSPFALGRALAGGGAPSQEMEPYSDEHGVPVVGAWSMVEGQAWLVVAEVDHSELVRPLSELWRAALVVGLVACAVVAIIASWAASALTSPLARIQGVAARLEHGDYGARCGMDRRDELGELGRAFDRTASALVARSEALEVEIEERMEAECRLRESEARTAAILSLAPDGVITLDARGRITGWNQRAEAIFGWFEPEMLGQPIVPTVVPPGHWVAQILSGGVAGKHPRVMPSPREIEIELARRDGRRVPTELRIIPLSFGDSGELCVFMRDITERKWAEEQARANHRRLEQHNAELLETRGHLQDSVHQLAMVNEELDSFAHIASHDLQERARNLVSFSELLIEDLGGDLPPEVAKDIDFIKAAAARMQNLVQDLLALSRAGKEHVDLEDVDLDECLDDAIESLHVRIAETGACIRRGRLPTVQGDRTLLTQVMQNLLSNALKFTRVNPVVEVVAREDAEGWEIGVRDNGIGIDPAQTEHIFKPFRRLHGTTEFEGSGIGLAVCQKGVALHGGRVWVESTPGEGSLFKFTIPRGVPRKEIPCIA